MLIKKLTNFHKRILTGIIGAAFLLAVSYVFEPDNLTWLGILFFILYSEMLIACYVAKEAFWKKAGVFIIWLGYLILGFSLLCLIAIRGILLEFCAVVFCVDIAAYAIGNMLKGPKLMAKVSPNKTISGFIGGLFAGSVMFEVLIADFVCPSDSMWFRLLIGAIFAIIVQFGDLLVSVAKRALKIKDASNLLPGHGGFWDRCDSIFAGAIFIVLFSLLRGSLYFLGN